MADERPAPREPGLADFLGEPTRDLGRWRWLWDGDHRFPIRSHRGVLGRLLVFLKRLARPFVTVPQNDLWERQRVFNLILLERLQALAELRAGERLDELELALPERLGEVMGHNDALYGRLDQKLDLYRDRADDLSRSLAAALAAVSETDGPRDADAAPGDGPADSPSERLIRALDEQAYLELERRFRGTPEEIAERLRVYLPRLEGRGPVLDLGCGRGEALAVMREHGMEARGIDASAGMVEQCRQRGLEAAQEDLFEGLARVPEATLGAVVSFHVIEHLPATAVDRLVRLAWRALAPGGLLVLETPSPLSLVVSARRFWIDPTHRRPIHPDSLELSYRLAGFDPVERLDLRPFPDDLRLPEVDLAELEAASRPLADRVNRLRDALDDLLFGYQDYALVGEKPA